MRFRIVLFLAVSILFLGGFKDSFENKMPKNILFIVVDDLNTMLGCYGDLNVKSPNIDLLAANGVKFENSHCQYPLCNPSRASFLSGKRPENLGIYGLNVSARKVLPDGVFLPEFFKNKGYFTAGAGKVYHSKSMNDPQSWDFYEDAPSKDSQELAALKFRGDGNGTPSWHELDSDGSLTQDGINTQTILRLMSEKSGENKPFFLAMGFHKPHLPWAAPKRFFDLYDANKIKVANEPKMKNVPPIALQTELTGFEQPNSRQEAMKGYLACISFIDYQIGLLINKLDELKLRENTIIVLVGDNGFHLGDHGGLWAKLSAFENATQVPMIFSGGEIQKDKTIKSPVELIDIYPTLMELSGYSENLNLDGKSLARTLTTPYLMVDNYAHSIVYHFDTTSRKDVLSQTIISNNWRYTSWNKGEYPSEFYLKSNGLSSEYNNRINDKKVKPLVQKAVEVLKNNPPVQPGNANRPRALLRKGEAFN